MAAPTPNVQPSAGDPITAIAMAIANAEGFGVVGAIPTLANNPGDLVLGDIGYGTMGPQKITVFGSVQDGWNALFKQVGEMIAGTSEYYNPSMTWNQIGAKYAGAGSPWAANVATNLGVDPNSTLQDYLNS